MNARSWPLVGRDAELAAIDDTRRDRIDIGVVVSGAAGVGKTRLMRAALVHAAEEGCDTSSVAPTLAAASIPFGAVSHLLPARTTVGADPLGVLCRITDDISARAKRSRVVLGVDDAHLLDDASAALIHLLATQERAFVIVTVRSGERTPDAIHRLCQEELVRRLRVAALPPEAVDLLVGHALGAHVDGITLHELRRLSDGNPLLLRELLEEATATGTLRERSGMWRWSGGLDQAVFLAEKVTARLNAVPPDVRAVLEIVACGEPIEVGLLGCLADRSTVDAAERGGLLVSQRTADCTVMRLAQPLYGELLRATLPSVRAREIWGQLAAALLQTPTGSREDVLLAGVWQLQSGTITYPGVLLPAARQALARFDLDLAERLARAAHGSTPTTQVERLVAEILRLRGRYQEAARVLSNPPVAGTNEAAHWAATRAAILYWGHGQAGDAERVLDSTATESPGADTTDAIRCWILLFEGRCRDALAAGQRVLERPTAGPEAIVRAATGVTAAAALLGRFDHASQTRSRALAVLSHLDRDELPWGAEQVGYATSLTLLAAGRLAEARAVADTGYRQSVAERATVAAGCWLAFRGVAEKTQGRPRTALSSLRESVVLLHDDDPYSIRRACLAKLASAAALTGDSAAATTWMTEADREQRTANGLFTSWVELDRAWVLAACGQHADAVRQAERAAQLARHTEQPTHEAIALYDVARLGGVGLVRSRLDELAGESEGSLAPALATATHALHAGDGRDLDRVTTVFADLGLVLLAAEAAACASRAYRKAGLAARAAASASRATVLASDCEGARTPLLDPTNLGELLTRREREVVTQAAHGLQSRQIGRRLGLSTRTVDNHLGSAYAKLGVSGRRELPALFGVQPGSVAP